MTIDSFFEDIDRGRDGRNWGYSLGLSKLEDLTDGLTKATYTLLFASSGVGKSSLALYSYIYRPIMEHLTDCKLKITLFALEMKKEMIYAKLLSTYVYEKYGVSLSMKEIFSRKKGYRLSDEHRAILEECKPWLEKVFRVLHVIDESMSANKFYKNVIKDLEEDGTFTDTEHHSGYVKNNPDMIHLFVVDHLNLAVPTGGRSKKEEIDLISNMAVGIRNRTEASFLMIMQSNRAVASMDRKKQGFNEPIKEDIKESGVPAEDAEIILALYDPNNDHLNTYKNWNIKLLGERFRAILCLKSRYGESNARVGCFYDGKVNYWEELPKEVIDYTPYLREGDVDNSISTDNVDNKDTNKRKFNYTL